MYGRKSAAVWKRQPLARLTSSTARPLQSARSSSSRFFSVSAAISLSNKRLSSLRDTGSVEASSAASRIRLASAGFCMAQFYVNRREGFGLRDLDEELAGKLQQREERHHQDRHAALGLE